MNINATKKIHTPFNVYLDLSKYIIHFNIVDGQNRTAWHSVKTNTNGT